MSSAKAALESDTRVSIHFFRVWPYDCTSLCDFGKFVFRCLLLRQEGNTRLESTLYLLVSFLSNFLLLSFQLHAME